MFLPEVWLDEFRKGMRTLLHGSWLLRLCLSLTNENIQTKLPFHVVPSTSWSCLCSVSAFSLEV